MKKTHKKVGRPPLVTGKRLRIIKAKITDDEFKSLLHIQKESGLNRAEIIRRRVLYGTSAVPMVNIGEVLWALDGIGAELGRAGNNINQLAKHANILNRQDKLHPDIVTEFNKLFTDYIRAQQELEKTTRQLLRAMKP